MIGSEIMLKSKVLILSSCIFLCFTSYNPEVGSVIDDLNEIPVYYNGNIANVFGRNITDSGYNLGLKYQCVEFVKRYYFEYYEHSMPDTYGHAKEFFDKSIEDSGLNEKRGLMQYSNTRTFAPKVGDIMVFDGSKENPFGHLGIISKVSDDEVEIIQQNWGKKTRHKMKLIKFNDIFTVADFHVLGWLRKE